MAEIKTVARLLASDVRNCKLGAKVAEHGTEHPARRSGNELNARLVTDGIDIALQGIRLIDHDQRQHSRQESPP